MDLFEYDNSLRQPVHKDSIYTDNIRHPDCKLQYESSKNKC